MEQNIFVLHEPNVSADPKVLGFGFCSVGYFKAFWVFHWNVKHCSPQWNKIPRFPKARFPMFSRLVVCCKWIPLCCFLLNAFLSLLLFPFLKGTVSFLLWHGTGISGVPGDQIAPYPEIEGKCLFRVCVQHAFCTRNWVSANGGVGDNNRWNQNTEIQERQDLGTCQPFSIFILLLSLFPPSSHPKAGAEVTQTGCQNYRTHSVTSLMPPWHLETQMRGPW